MWWIAFGLVGLAAVVFLLAVGALLGSLHAWRDQLRTCVVRASAASQVEPALAVTQQRMEDLQGPLRIAETRASGLQARLRHPPAG